VGPRAGLDAGARRKNPLPLPGIEPRSPDRVARRQTLYCLSYRGSDKFLFCIISNIGISLTINIKYNIFIEADENEVCDAGLQKLQTSTFLNEVLRKQNTNR
jgi:hypothetical protein